MQEQRESVKKWRQIGLGFMGLADLFIELGIEYGSDRSIELSEKIGEILINKAIQTSANIAKEKGTYPAYDEKATLQSEFIKNVANQKTIDHIKKYGLRNSQITVIAPTGSTSNLFNASGGIEPLFKVSYTRKTESLHDKDQEYEVFSPVVEELMDKKDLKSESELPDYIVSANEIDYKDRIKMQATWQKYIDASISSTINMPNETTIKEIKNAYIEGWEKGLKGMTVFREGCKREGILKSKEEMKNKKTEMSRQDFIDNGICPECKSDLVQAEGCIKCTNCGWSGCSV